MEFSTLIFDIFDEVRIQGIVIDHLDHSLGAFGLEDSHDIAWEMVRNYLQIHRKRFVEFIEDDFDNSLINLKKIENMGWRIRDYCLSEHFNMHIRVYRYATSIVLNHEYIHPNSNLTVRFYFLNEDYYNLFKNIELNNKANLNQISKEEIKKM